MAPEGSLLYPITYLGFLKNSLGDLNRICPTKFAAFPVLMIDASFRGSSMSSNPDVAGLMHHRNTVREKRSATASFASPALYGDHNAVERVFGRLKDFRRIGTRYDRRADVYLSVVCLAAAVSDCL